MNLPEPYKADEVDHLLINAQLRDELEPLYDEAIGRVNPHVMTTRSENEFLASMLEWERAPMIPIYRWFEPELVIPSPDRISHEQLSSLLVSTIDKLFQKHIVLDFTEHLSDYELYCLLYRDILPAYEKKLDHRNTYVHWDCANTSDDPETWLRFYASDDEREVWAEENHEELPPHEDPPHPRRLPRVPL